MPAEPANAAEWLDGATAFAYLSEVEDIPHTGKGAPAPHSGRTVAPPPEEQREEYATSSATSIGTATIRPASRSQAKRVILPACIVVVLATGGILGYMRFRPSRHSKPGIESASVPGETNISLGIAARNELGFPPESDINQIRPKQNGAPVSPSISAPSDQGVYIYGNGEWLKVPKLQADFVPTPDLLASDKISQPQGPWRGAYWVFKSMGSGPVITGQPAVLQVNLTLPNLSAVVKNENPKPLILKLAAAGKNVWKVQRYTYPDLTKGYGDQVQASNVAEQVPNSYRITFPPSLSPACYGVFTENGTYLFEVR